MRMAHLQLAEFRSPKTGPLCRVISFSEETVNEETLVTFFMTLLLFHSHRHPPQDHAAVPLRVSLVLSKGTLKTLSVPFAMINLGNMGFSSIATISFVSPACGNNSAMNNLALCSCSFPKTNHTENGERLRTKRKTCVTLKSSKTVPFVATSQTLLFPPSPLSRARTRTDSSSRTRTGWPQFLVGTLLGPVDSLRRVLLKKTASTLTMMQTANQSPVNPCRRPVEGATTCESFFCSQTPQVIVFIIILLSA